jgi:ubiquinone/menaquinone biosynthesis C-methylase UbiE
MREGLYTNKPGANHSYDKAEFAESYGRVLEQTLEYLKSKKILELNEESKVLEFGAGAGQEAQHIRKLTGAQVLEADVSLAAYQAAPKPERKFVVVSAELPYPDNYFSFIHCKDALVHIEDKVSLFAEFKRVLAPSGMLLLTTEANAGSLEMFSESRMGRMMMFDKLYKRKGYFSITTKALKELLHNSGFEIVQNPNWKPKKDEKNWYGSERTVLLLKSKKQK